MCIRDEFAPVDISSVLCVFVVVYVKKHIPRFLGYFVGHNCTVCLGRGLLMLNLEYLFYLLF